MGILATFTTIDPFEGPWEELDPDVLTKYYYLLNYSETITMSKYFHTYEKDKYNISFLSDDEVKKKLIDKDNEHKNNITSGRFTSFIYPQTALYKVSIQPILAQAKTTLEEKPVTIEYKKIPKPILLAYIELLKDIENRGKVGRRKIPYERDENGNTILDQAGRPIIRYEREQTEYGEYKDYLRPNGNNSGVLVYRWFSHDDGIGYETIGYGHRLTINEKRLRFVTINDYYSVTDIDKNGLSDADVDRLLMTDVEKRIGLTQSFLGPVRWNHVIDNRPSHAILLVEKQFNGGNDGLRGWPKLLYHLGLTDNEDYFENTNYTSEQKSAILASKLIYNFSKLTKKPQGKPYTFSGFKDIPFTPKKESFFSKDDIYFQSKLKEIVGMGGYVVRNKAISETFIYLSGSDYDKYTAKGGGFTK